MKDHVVSEKTGEIYAEINFEKDEKIPYFYRGEIVENNFPKSLSDLIDEQDELIEAFSMTLLDEVEKEIYNYGLKLKSLNAKIFSLSMKRNIITFFLKYPTSRGFLDDYPE